MSSKRKQYMLDRKFQLRATFTLIGTLFIAFAIIVGGVGINMLDVNERISNMLLINKSIADTFSAPGPDVSKEEYQTYLRLQEQHDMNKQNLDKMINFNKRLIWVIIGFVILQALIFFFILIRQTHRIVGPMHVMTNYMRQIAKGNIPEHVRELREKDYFRENYEVFKEMVQSLKAREKK
jgi:nitrogen fixation/metabolism regulation signal transduction histidine kinase